MAIQLTKITATGQVTTRNSIVRTVYLTAGAQAAATLVLRNGLAGSTDIKAVINAASGLTQSVDLAGAEFPLGIHATLTGAGVEVGICWGTG